MMPARNIVLVVVSFAIFFEALDIAIVNLAIPLVRNDFNLPHETIQWIQTVYVLFYGGFLIIGGKLSDTFNRKNVFLVGTALFMVASLGAGLSSSLTALLVFRAIQGIGAAIMMPSSFSIITNIFTDSAERNKAVGIFGAFAALGSGSGLAIGGIIATYFGWQWIFFMNVPVMAICLFISYRYVPIGLPSGISRPDIVSGLVLTSAILLLTFLIHDLNKLLLSPLLTAGLSAAVALLFVTFVRRNRLVSNPLIDIRIFHDSDFALSGNSVFVLFGAFFSGFLFLLPIIMQNDLGYTAAETGLILVPFSILSALTAKFVVPVMMKNMSVIQAAIVGLSIMAVGGAFLISGVALNAGIWVIVAAIACVTGVGIAICFTTLTVWVIQDVDEEHHGLASSLMNTAFFFGSGLGLGLIGLVMQLGNSRLPVVITLGSYAIAALLLLVLVSGKKISRQRTKSTSSG